MTNEQIQLEEGDVVLCVVDRIVGIVVFVKILDPLAEGKEGSIVVSEVAPGRIRNLRNYVVPKKKIVCKVLRIDNTGNMHLSLRRVKEKERKEVMEQYKQERSSTSILKTILEKETQKIVEKIKTDYLLITDFLQKAKDSPELLEKYVSKEQAKKILEILNKQKTKISVVKKDFFLKSFSSNGIEQIKNILKEFAKEEKIEIRYISAGKYSIRSESENIKSADQRANLILEELEKKAKEKKMEVSYPK